MDEQTEKIENEEPKAELAEPKKEPEEPKKEKLKKEKKKKEKKEKTGKIKEGAELQWPPRRNSRKLTGKEWLVILIPAIAAIAAVILAVVLTQKVPRLTLEEDCYQVYGEANVVVPKGTELLVSDGDTILKSGNNEEITTLPIYLRSREAAIVTINMLYYQPRTRKYNLVPPLAEMGRDTYGQVYQTREGKTVKAGAGFLYDGADFYLFLEPVTLNLPNYTIELPALSYLEAAANSDIMIFNYETGKVRMIENDGKGTAVAGSGDYEISIFGDTVTMHDGSKMLLASRPELFDTL